MSLDLHEGNGLETEKHCTPTTSLRTLHDDQEPTFGRWLGQINGQR